MKKFLLSAAMLIAAIGMSAAGSYYVAGNGGADGTGKWCNGINWDPGAPANAIIGGQIVFADVPDIGSILLYAACLSRIIPFKRYFSCK